MSLVGITKIVQDLSDSEREEFCRSMMRELDAERSSVTTTLAWTALLVAVVTLFLLIVFGPEWDVLGLGRTHW